MTRSTWIRALLAVLGCLLLYLAFSGYVVSEAFKYRSYPSGHSDVVRRNARGWAPHNAAAMAIVLHRGSPAYRIYTRTLLYLRLGKAKFSPWTKWMLRDDFRSMSDEEFNLFVQSYPGDYNQIHGRILRNLGVASTQAMPRWQGGDALESDSAQADAIGRLINVLNRYPAGRTAFLTWYVDTIVRPGLKAGFEEQMWEICRFDSVDYGVVFKRLMEPSYDDPDGNLYMLSRCVPATGRAGESFGRQLQRYSTNAPDTAVGMLPFLGRKLFERSEALTSNEDATIHRIASKARDCEFSGLFARTLPRSDDEEEPEARISGEDKKRILDQLRSVLDTARQRQDSCAEIFFAEVASREVEMAEALFEPYRRAPDSTLRKDMIVHLANVGSGVGLKQIDDAFTGLAPRTAMFWNWEVYIDSSKAGAAYKQLAMHDYMETGKQFPPAYKDGGAPSQAEVAKWKDFIQRYPWFPGTDDAYYRAAYAAYATGDVYGALNLVREYADRNFPDEDADVYMLQLLGAISEAHSEDSFLPAERLDDLHVARAYALLPIALAGQLISTREECALIVDRFVSVAWLRALTTTQRREMPEPDFCDDYFIAYGQDGAALAKQLGDSSEGVVKLLALPGATAAHAFVDGSLMRLTQLNIQVVNDVRSAQANGNEPPAVSIAWLRLLLRLNRTYGSECGNHGGAYCASAAASIALGEALKLEPKAEDNASSDDLPY
jgi:hypothetical protein